MSIGFNLVDNGQLQPLVVEATGLAGPLHPAEADMFSRQSAMPGHDQRRLDGPMSRWWGAGDWAAGLPLALSEWALIDGDRLDRTNAPRQLMLASDVGEPKAHALARNLAIHATNAAQIVGVPQPFDELAMTHGPFDCLVVGVDKNRARLVAARLGVTRRIPVVFGMLSTDGLRAQVFLQQVGGPCLACVLPNLEDGEAMPCAAVAIASCFLVAGHAIELVVNALTQTQRAPRWRETSLDGSRECSSNPKHATTRQLSHKT